MQPAVIQTQGLCRDFSVGSQVVHALRDVDLLIHRGEFIAIMGPSGSGKSTGQMQRVAIARAVVNEPDIVLADEPTGALDTATGLEILDLLKELNGQGMTVIVVTHEMEVAGYAERVLKFRDGRLLAENQAVDKTPLAAPADTRASTP